MKKVVTLNSIRDVWGLPELKEKNRQALALALVSDAFNREMTGGGLTVQSIGDSSVGNFVSGNFRAKSRRDITNVGLLKDMLIKIEQDTNFTYRKELDRPPTTCRRSMLRNIRYWVEQTVPAITPDHPLFTELELIEWDRIKPGERGQYQVIQGTIDALREENTPGSLVYAVFLLVMAGIFRELLATAPSLYELQTVRAYIEGIDEEEAFSGYADDPFVDPDYMHDYHVYLFRIGYNHLYNRAELRLRMEEGKPFARMTLHDDGSYVKGRVIDRIFEGVPYRSAHDKSVYAMLRDQNGAMGILLFQHQKFNYGTMYFRSGMFITRDSGMRVPVVQKVIICSRALSPGEYPYAEGFLKTGGSSITLTQGQLEDFMTAFRDYPWMEEFKSSILPFIQNHACTCYRFDENEILAYSLTRLDEQDRLKVMLALKSLAEANRRETRNSVDCLPHPDLHKLFGEK